MLEGILRLGWRNLVSQTPQSGFDASAAARLTSAALVEEEERAS
jgi:hypothetical protein